MMGWVFVAIVAVMAFGCALGLLGFWKDDDDA